MNGQAFAAKSGPSHDIVDAVFLRRLHPSPPPRNPSPAPPDETPASVTVAPATQAGPQPLVAWLLERAPDQWTALALTVEKAVAEGLRIVAVAGGTRGEGRTTLVEGLAATLTARGWQVMRASRPVSSRSTMPDGHGSERTVMLVDAGVWFPPGPIRLDRVAAMSAGCDAVILVRRASQAPAPARAAAIEQAGCRLLGEVVTFEEPRHDDTN